MQIHPDLARLMQHYEQLVAAAAAGSVGPDEAYAMLAQLRITDAAGAVWSIDDEGQFVRQQNPMSQPERVPPGVFAGGTLPAGAPANVPAVAQQHPARAQAPMTAPGGAGFPGAARSLPDATAMERSPFAENSGEGFVRHRSATRPGLLTVLRSRARGRELTILVLALAVTGPVVAVATRGNAPVRAGGGVTVPAQSTTSAPAGTIVETALPASADLERVHAALLNGDTSVLADNGAGDATGAQLALWTGLAGQGTIVSGGDPVASDGVVRQVVRVDGPTLPATMVLRVTWVRNGGTWQLAGWPERVS